MLKKALPLAVMLALASNPVLASTQSDAELLKATQAQAKEGDADAQVRMALYYAGEDTLDYEKTRYWAERSAAQGNTEGMAILATLYRMGFGVDIDMKKAFQWELKAAEADHPGSQASVAWHYYNGEGVQNDAAQAMAWAQRAAINGDADGYAFAGRMLIDGEGEGLVHNPALGLAYMYQSKALGYEDAAEEIAHLEAGLSASVVDAGRAAAKAWQN